MCVRMPRNCFSSLLQSWAPVIHLSGFTFSFKKKKKLPEKSTLGRQRIHTQDSGGGRWEPSGSFIKTSAARNSLTQPRLSNVTLPSVLNLPWYTCDKSASESGRNSNSKGEQWGQKGHAWEPAEVWTEPEGFWRADSDWKTTAAAANCSVNLCKRRLKRECRKRTTRLVKTCNRSRVMMGSHLHYWNRVTGREYFFFVCCQFKQFKKQ